MDPEYTNTKRYADRQSVRQQIIDRAQRGGAGSQQEAETDRSPLPERSAALSVSSSSSAAINNFLPFIPQRSVLPVNPWPLTHELLHPDLSPFTSRGHGQCPAVYQPVSLFYFSSFTLYSAGIPVWAEVLRPNKKKNPQSCFFPNHISHSGLPGNEQHNITRRQRVERGDLLLMRRLHL